MVQLEPSITYLYIQYIYIYAHARMYVNIHTRTHIYILSVLCGVYYGLNLIASPQFLSIVLLLKYWVVFFTYSTILWSANRRTKKGATFNIYNNKNVTQFVFYVIYIFVLKYLQTKTSLNSVSVCVWLIYESFFFFSNSISQSDTFPNTNTENM